MKLSANDNAVVLIEKGVSQRDYSHLQFTSPYNKSVNARTQSNQDAELYYTPASNTWYSISVEKIDSNKVSVRFNGNVLGEMTWNLLLENPILCVGTDSWGAHGTANVRNIKVIRT